MELGQNYFELFDLPVGFNLDEALLAKQYRTLQKVVHPDRYASHPEKEQGIAVRLASYLNEAYDVLKSPVKRSVYLLKLAGVDIDFDRTTTSDSEFLYRQMALRESLSDVEESEAPEAALNELKQTARQMINETEMLFASEFESGQLEQAKVSVAKLYFMNKFIKDVKHLEDKILDE